MKAYCLMYDELIFLSYRHKKKGAGKSLSERTEKEKKGKFIYSRFFYSCCFLFLEYVSLPCLPK